ncbi:DNA topoisomerase [Bifidobacterium bifidum]|uniref:topoisomerase C-terminal repeat-containing protein n=1 Tax=Bifidobacterium bifidum TaxID=1681 RepID=UPI003CD0C667
MVAGIVAAATLLSPCVAYAGDGGAGSGPGSGPGSGIGTGKVSWVYKDSWGAPTRENAVAAMASIGVRNFGGAQSNQAIDQALNQANTECVNRSKSEGRGSAQCRLVGLGFVHMWEAVGDDYVHDVTNVVANIDPHWCEKHPDEGRLLPEGECRFTSRSDQPVSPGWHAIEHAAPQEDQDDTDETAGNIIPVNLTDGVFIAPVPQGGATLSEGKTKPPKPFTEATLLAAMEHASRWVEDKELKAALDDDESHSGGIGTPATRANIIEQLVHSGYVDRKGKQLRSTEQGRSLIDVVATKLKDVALTAGMERRLSEVEHNHADPAQVETEFRDLAVRIPADARSAVRQDHVQTKTRNTESFGPCPRCGKPVIKTGKVFQCSTNRREKQSDGTWRTTEGCGWRAWTTVAGKTVNDSAIRRLLAGRKVSLKGFTSKKGSKFDASLVVDKDRGVTFDFGNKH